MNGIGIGYWGFHPVVTVVYITISDLSSLITCHTVHREVMTDLSSSKQGEELLSVHLVHSGPYTNWLRDEKHPTFLANGISEEYVGGSRFGVQAISCT